MSIQPPFGSNLTRRSLLAGSAALAGAAMLSGCGPDGSVGGDQGATGRSEVELPTYIPYGGVTPDIPPPNEYCIPGFLRFPDPPVAGVQEKPGDGTHTVTGFTQTSISVAPPMDQNHWWRNLNEQMGITFDLQWLKGADYVSKVQTLIAGDDLPDVIALPRLPRMDQVLESKFLDITEYVAGDAIAEYPMLASLPTSTWQAASYHGSIYGLTRSFVPITFRLEARTDTFEQLGVRPEFNSGEEFLALCREITDPKADRFAMSKPKARFIRSMFVLPNEWESTDQGFRHEIESPRYMEYLEFVANMWKEGLFHPKSFQNPSRMTMFQKPSFLLYEVGGPGFTRAMPLYRPAAPTLTVKPVVVPLLEGGGNAPARVMNGGDTHFALRGDLEPNQVKRVLRLLNFTASHFGTEEFLTVQYGKEGYNYELDSDGQPVANERGQKELFPITLFPGALVHHYAPDFPEVVKNECAYEAEASQKVILNAAAGLFSATASQKQAQLDKHIDAALGAVIQGHKKVSEWPDVVKTWAAKGGDQIRKEYEEASATQ